MAFAPKELQAEREEQAAEQWRLAKRQAKGFGVGCLAVAILALCALFYVVGYTAAILKPDRPEVTSTR